MSDFDHHETPDLSPSKLDQWFFRDRRAQYSSKTYPVSVIIAIVFLAGFALHFVYLAQRDTAIATREEVAVGYFGDPLARGTYAFTLDGATYWGYDKRRGGRFDFSAPPVQGAETRVYYDPLNPGINSLRDFRNETADDYEAAAFLTVGSLCYGIIAIWRYRRMKQGVAQP